jgi:hypothetical protein
LFQEARRAAGVCRDKVTEAGGHTARLENGVALLRQTLEEFRQAPAGDRREDGEAGRQETSAEHAAMARRIAELEARVREADEEADELRARLREAEEGDYVGAAYTPDPDGLPPEAEVEDLQGHALDAYGQPRRLGEILVSSGVVTQAQLDDALSAQGEAPHRRLGVILRMKGFTGEDVVAKVLACQLQLPFVRLNEHVVDEKATGLITARMARHHACIPIALEQDRIQVAMTNPLNLIALDDLSIATGRQVEPVVATSADVSAAIERYFGGAAPR